MGWDYGRMGGWDWAGMGVGLIVLGGLIVAGVIYLTRAGGEQRQDPAAPRTPQQVLADRLARGDIDTAEYQDRMKALPAP